MHFMGVLEFCRTWQLPLLNYIKPALIYVKVKRFYTILARYNMLLYSV